MNSADVRPRPARVGRSRPLLLLAVAAVVSVIAGTLVGMSDRGQPGSPAYADATPGPSNTGVPEGVDLLASGSVTVTEDGAVIDGLHISGVLTIRGQRCDRQEHEDRCRRQLVWRSDRPRCDRVGDSRL